MKKKKKNHGTSEVETDDGNSSNTDCDQDSDTSFMKVTHVEHMKRSTDENPMLDQNTQKNEMEISDENCIFTRRGMGNESSRMEP